MAFLESIIKHSLLVYVLCLLVILSHQTETNDNKDDKTSQGDDGTTIKPEGQNDRINGTREQSDTSGSNVSAAGYAPRDWRMNRPSFKPWKPLLRPPPKPIGPYKPNQPNKPVPSNPNSPSGQPNGAKIVLSSDCGANPNVAGQSGDQDSSGQDERNGSRSGLGGRAQMRITDGTIVRHETYPSVVFLRTYKGSCSGVLIHERVVLTAAHCLSHGKATVWFTSDKRQVQGAPTQKSAIFCTPSRYSSQGISNFDIGLVVLEKPLRGLNGLSEPACLLDRDLREDERATLVGFGMTADWAGDKNSGGPMQSLEVEVLGKACRIKRGPKVACYKEAYAGSSCSGDSGAPVFAKESDKHYVGAIHFAGASQCKPGDARFYGSGMQVSQAKTDYIDRWIKSINEGRLDKECRFTMTM